ncbi:MerR family DNA-binding transcriptional regulator [Ketogulonicigenium vulgare]|uniref:HTH merR-type domain-containing protein n=1 Tax=Ketogulonicigenium vulgare (strain WSH-001) TaxID=759362 RepID=F9Y4J2_KETVW|nr:MerR family DNA-binding transcriptional regulator [Ketogulonicigenium vulgare]AEM40549.1 hypothetical protein KVU_0710 [Ketogulonicigenium vulgare WSH-001]
MQTKLITTQDIKRVTGLSPRAIRHYESLELIPPQQTRMAFAAAYPVKH